MIWMRLGSGFSLLISLLSRRQNLVRWERRDVRGATTNREEQQREGKKGELVGGKFHDCHNSTSTNTEILAWELFTKCFCANCVIHWIVCERVILLHSFIALFPLMSLSSSVIHTLKLRTTYLKGLLSEIYEYADLVCRSVSPDLQLHLLTGSQLLSSTHKLGGLVS